MSSFFPMMFALQPAQAVSLGILSSQAVILAVLDKIAGYFVQYPPFRALGRDSRQIIVAGRDSGLIGQNS